MTLNEREHCYLLVFLGIVGRAGERGNAFDTSHLTVLKSGRFEAEELNRVQGVASSNLAVPTIKHF